jgi:hypothetical protein
VATNDYHCPQNEGNGLSTMKKKQIPISQKPRYQGEFFCVDNKGAKSASLTVEALFTNSSHLQADVAQSKI